MARHYRTSTLVLALALLLVPALPLLAWAGGPSPAAVRAEAYFGSDPWDAVDNTWATAPTLPSVSRHQFTSLGDRYLYTADEDWFKVSCPATGTPVTVNVARIGGQGGSYLDVYGSTGGSCDATSIAFAGPADPRNAELLLGSQKAGWWGSGMASMYFVAPHPGTYYFRHRPAVVDDAGQFVATGPGYPRDAIPNVAKEAVTYELHVVVGSADRIAGNSRYNTAIGVTRQMWNAADDPWYGFGGPWGNGVILVSGQSFADGLAATSFSLRSGLPVLLTPQGALTPEVKAEIERLATGNWSRPWDGDNTFTVYICGSDAVVSLGIEDALHGDKYVTSVKRVEGPDRYATAVAIANETSATSLNKRYMSGPAPVRVKPREAFVINGAAWADGLAAGPVAAFADAPVLMVQTNALPDVTRDWLVENRIESVHVVGGPTVVAPSVMGAIASLPTTPTVDRIAGASRYETAYLVARYGVDNYGMSDGGCTVVSGESPWDALSAGQLSFMTYTPLLLTPRASLSSFVPQFHGKITQPSYVVGGEPAVGASAYNTLRDLWK